MHTASACAPSSCVSSEPAMIRIFVCTARHSQVEPVHCCCLPDTSSCSWCKQTGPAPWPIAFYLEQGTFVKQAAALPQIICFATRLLSVGAWLLLWHVLGGWRDQAGGLTPSCHLSCAPSCNQAPPSFWEAAAIVMNQCQLQARQQEIFGLKSAFTILSTILFSCLFSSLSVEG